LTANSIFAKVAIAVQASLLHNQDSKARHRGLISGVKKSDRDSPDPSN
jgi:hypothetical protein